MTEDFKLPIRIVSDLHLGHATGRIEQVDSLRNLFIGAGTVIFNGDTWQELTRDFRAKSEVMLTELKQMGEKLGVSFVFLPGNHDPSWPGKGWLELAGGKIVVLHGDTLMWNGSPWSREAFSRAKTIRELWGEHPEAASDIAARIRLARKIARALKPENVPKGRNFMLRIIDAIFPPQRALEILRVWGGMGTEGMHFLNHYFPQAEVLVMGHFHRQGIWRKSGKLIINTGAFQTMSRSRWVEWDGESLSSGYIKGRGNRDFVKGVSDGIWHFS